ncbi:phage minor capsid protein [Ligilactobacillus saerimneri]
MDANQRIHNDADQLANMYANLESRIFTEIIQVLQKGKQQDVTAENVIEWQAQQLAKAGLLVKKVIQIMAEYDQLDPAYIEQVLQQDGYQIVDETTAELEKLGKKAPEVSSNANNLLDSLVNQTRQTLDNTVNQRLLTRNINQNAAVRTYQSILKKSTIETVTGLKTHEQAIKDAIYKQIDEGIPVLKDRAGRTWSLEAYTRMVLTTTANRAYNDARTKRMQEMGQNLCVMTAHPNSRPACAYIQGKVVNIVPDDSPDYNPKYDTIYNHGYGTPAGTLGINCRHVLFPFEEGVNVNHQPQYDPKEAIKNGNLQQRQRAFERSIRNYKKRLNAAEMLGDDETATKIKTLIAGRQKQLREFIKDTNKGAKNGPILVRDYSREQAYDK